MRLLWSTVFCNYVLCALQWSSALFYRLDGYSSARHRPPLQSTRHKKACLHELPLICSAPCDTQFLSLLYSSTVKTSPRHIRQHACESCHPVLSAYREVHLQGQQSLKVVLAQVATKPRPPTCSAAMVRQLLYSEDPAGFTRVQP